jgi:hydrogenase maturation factor
MDEVFELREAFEWRGLGKCRCQALKIRPEPTAPSTPKSL